LLQNNDFFKQKSALIQKLLEFSTIAGKIQALGWAKGGPP
jgi:hypothetical protein